MKQALRLPVYRRLLLAYTLNELVWSIGTIALAVLVYRRTGSAFGSAGFFLCSQVVPAFFSPLLVARVEGHAPRRMLPVLYALEAILFGVLAWLTSRFSLAPVLAITVLDGIVAIAARALARTATVNVLRPANLLEDGNAVTNLAFSVSFMAGPAIGGVVVATGGTVAALLVDCGLFAAIAVILVSTAGLPRASTEAESPGGRLRAALAHVKGDRALRWLLLLQAAGWVAFAISIPVEVIFAGQTLHAGPGGYGALLSGWGAGAVVGSAAYARWRRGPARVLISLSGASLAAGFAILAAAPTIVVAVIGAALGGGGNGVASAAVRTVQQQYTPARWMATVMSLNESISQAAPGIGILLGGVLTALVNPRLAFAVGATGSLIFALVVWIVMRPGALPEPSPQDEEGPDAPPEELVGAAAAGRETLV